MEVIDYIDVFMRNVVGTTHPIGDALFLLGWSRDDWAKLLSHTVPQRFRAGDMVIQRSALDRTLNFVASGTLAVGIIQVDGVSIVQLAHIAAGSVVGEQSFFDSQPRSANVWATSDGELLRLDFAEFENFSRAEPALTRDLLFALGRVLSARLRNTSFRVRR
jgi:CRP/FNR family transcriptional regulator, cyclic AMP receptor protein